MNLKSEAIDLRDLPVGNLVETDSSAKSLPEQRPAERRGDTGVWKPTFIIPIVILLHERLGHGHGGTVRPPRSAIRRDGVREEWREPAYAACREALRFKIGRAHV